MCLRQDDAPEEILLTLVWAIRLRTAVPQPRSMQVSPRVSLLAPLSRHSCLSAAQRTPDSLHIRVWLVWARAAVPDAFGAQANAYKSTRVHPLSAQA